MKRTILYYPTIQIRNSKWIKRAIFYWDAIGSIVPRDFNFPQYSLNDMALLRDHNAYHAYHPEQYVRHNRELEQEFETIRHLPEFHSFSGGYTFNRRDFRIYLPKFNGDFAQYLLESGSVDREGDWLLFTQREGMLYMSLLAKYLADEDYRSATVPGTDWGGYQRLALSISSAGKSIPVLSLRIDSVLPVPRHDVDLKKILAFKEKRGNELLEFRKVIRELQKQLKSAETPGEIQDHLANFSENLELGVSNLVRLAEEEKISIVLGTIESVFSINLPDIISIAAGATTSPVVAAVGIAGSGTVKVSRYLIDKANERRRRLTKDAYSYIYLAQRERIIDRP